VVVPSWAVTEMLIGFVPSLRPIVGDAAPDTTVLLPTLIVALPLLAIGVKPIEETLLATEIL
jgi:hypothetical protein